LASDQLTLHAEYRRVDPVPTSENNHQQIQQHLTKPMPSLGSSGKYKMNTENGGEKKIKN